MSIIAFRLERSGSTVCRKVVRNRDQGTGCYVPYRVGKLNQAARNGGSSHPGPLEGRFHNGHREQEHHKHASRKVEPNVTLPHQPDDQESDKVQEVIVRKMAKLPKVHTQLADMGPGFGNGACRGRLLLRPALTIAARRQ